MNYFQNYVLPYTATPLVIQFGFDKWKYSYENGQAAFDSGTTFLSLMLSKVIANAFSSKMVGKVDNYYSNNFLSYLTEPAFNIIFYGIGYYFFKQTQSGYKQKSNMALITIPLIQSFISMFIYLNPAVFLQQQQLHKTVGFKYKAFYSKMNRKLLILN